MKKISIYVYDEIEGATENSISKLIDFLWDNNIEVVNIKQEIINNEYEALNFESDEKGNVITSEHSFNSIKQAQEEVEKHVNILAKSNI